MQPHGFEVKGDEEKVDKLKKALYGLKQPPRACYGRLDLFLMKYAFERSKNEHRLLIKKIEGDILIVGIYVDDMISIFMGS